MGDKALNNKVRRLAEKYHRLAYEIEHDARRMRAEGLGGLADTLLSFSSPIGKFARNLEYRD